ncbi:MAG: glycosyltransferase family 2 protein [bacterium]
MATRNLAVVPAFNEARSIGPVVRQIRRELPGWDTLVIDDGSRDDTAQAAHDAGALVVRAPYNLGIGGAVQTGFIWAREGGYDRMVQIDGDGQHEADEVGALESAMAESGVDMVCGSRFLDEGNHYPAPISRRTGIHIFAFLLSVFLRQRITDPTYGFRLYNRRAIELFASDYPHDYPEVEVVLMLHQHRLKMKEVPVQMQVRRSGTSSISSGKSAYYMIKVLLALFVGLLRAREPEAAAGQGG